MNIVITGGGTGGHVYPALEIARELIQQGETVHYFGSMRGQERRVCQRESISFQGFPSQPLYRLSSLRGMQGAIQLARATIMARQAIRRLNPDAVFSTGGYASAPVVYAAKKLGIPFVIHEQNTVPGRTNRILAKDSYCIATTFRKGAEFFPEARVVRTGMPVRREFREASQGTLGFSYTVEAREKMLLVMGGSQGAQTINEVALSTAARMTDDSLRWLHVAGPNHYEGMLQTLQKLAAGDHYTLKAFLEATEMASAMFACDLAVCRSGAGTLAELAALRKPAVLIPYPAAFADHQRVNAQEFVEIGAATMIDEKDLQPANLAKSIQDWLSDAGRVAKAAQALSDWSVDDSSKKIVDLVRNASNRVAWTE